MYTIMVLFMKPNCGLLISMRYLHGHEICVCHNITFPQHIALTLGVPNECCQLVRVGSKILGGVGAHVWLHEVEPRCAVCYIGLHIVRQHYQRICLCSDLCMHFGPPTRASFTLQVKTLLSNRDPQQLYYIFHSHQNRSTKDIQTPIQLYQKTYHHLKSSSRFCNIFSQTTPFVRRAYLEAN